MNNLEKHINLPEATVKTFARGQRWPMILYDECMSAANAALWDADRTWKKEKGATYRGWACICIRNAIKNEIKKWGRQHNFTNNVCFEKDFKEKNRDISVVDAMDFVGKRISNLSGDQKQALRWKYWEGFNNSEIAVFKGLTPEGARQRILAAQDAMKKPKARKKSVGRKDLTGKRYGHMVVVGLSDKKNGRPERLWDCRCDCGEVAVYPTYILEGKRALSCGCKWNVREKYSWAKLTPERVRQIRCIRKRYGLSYKKLADMFCVGTTTIFKVVHRKSWARL